MGRSIRQYPTIIRVFKEIKSRIEKKGFLGHTPNLYGMLLSGFLCATQIEPDLDNIARIRQKTKNGRRIFFGNCAMVATLPKNASANYTKLRDGGHMPIKICFCPTAMCAANALAAMPPTNMVIRAKNAVLPILPPNSKIRYRYCPTNHQ